MTTLTQPAWYGCPDDPDLCDDPECPNLAHLPDRDDTIWGGLLADEEVES